LCVCICVSTGVNFLPIVAQLVVITEPKPIMGHGGFTPSRGPWAIKIVSNVMPLHVENVALGSKAGKPRS